jgi:hypothetical protein
VSKALIFYPSVVMALLTLVMIASMGLRRYAAVAQRKVNFKLYRTFNPAEGEEPEPMRRHTRHVQNHFELPPLFHLAVFGTYLVGEVGPATLAAAWLFVASRGVHSVIHMTYNKVLHRFLAYGVGLVAVAFLWVRLALTLAA